MRKVYIVCMLVVASLFLLFCGRGWAQSEAITEVVEEFASLNGLALVADPYTIAGGTSNAIGYLSDGEALAFEAGDVFSFAPVQLPDKAKIKEIICVVKDNSEGGYIQVSLLLGPINTTDPVIPLQVIASAVTFPNNADPDFIQISGDADATLAEVNNEEYGYFFRVDFLDNGAGEAAELTLRGMVVRYTREISSMDHSHSYLTGKGAGHNTTAAETGPANFLTGP